MCLCLTTYFGFHAIQGRHGLEARSKLISRSKVLEREISALETVRSRLAREVALLSEQSPDPDFVDELARRLLGFAHPDDRVLVGTSESRPAATTAR